MLCRIFLPILMVSAGMAQKMPLADLLTLAAKKPNAPEFAAAVRATLGEAELKKGTAYLGHEGDFLFALDTAQTPQILLDDQPSTPKRIKGTDLWFHAAKLKTGTSHSYRWRVDGKEFGGNPDVPAYLPDCYEKPAVPKGTLSEKMVHESRIYPGLKSNWWTYVPAQYDGRTPMAVMVWQDGEGHVNRDGAAPTLNVVDNLIAQKKIPVMMLVLISPGLVGRQRWRSIEYDTVDDTYPRFLRDEILVEVAKKYKIRADGYSRAVAGNSSGGDRRVQRGVVDAGRIQPRAVADWQLHEHPMETGRAGRRQRVSEHDPQAAEAEHPGVAAGRQRRSGE